MKLSIVLCLLAVVLIQQCMCTHIHHEGEKSDEDYETHMRHFMGDHHKHHKPCDHPAHKEEDHELMGHAFHRHGDHIDHNVRLGFQAEDKQ